MPVERPPQPGPNPQPRPRPRKRAPRPRSDRGKVWLRARFTNLTPRARGVLWGLGALLATLGLALGGLLLGYGRARGPAGPRLVELDWPAGLSSEEAAALLAERGLVESRDTMTVFLRATGGTGDFVPGAHLLFEGATPWELRRLLARSFLRPFTRVTIPEGYNRFDIGARLEKLRVAGKKAFVAASADPVLLGELGIAAPGVSSSLVESAEGYLFPATYDLGLDSDPREIVRRLVAESDRRWEILAARHKDGLARLRVSPGWGRREILLVASIIEKEAAVDDDRPLIASVFLNRLLDPDFKPRRLQSDPTSSYGCIAWPEEAPSCAAFAGKPTPAVNHDARNRYSTYVHNGLPPTPIASPGERSLVAVLDPARARWLYFVAKGGGRHTFSETLDLHNDAVKRGPIKPDKPDKPDAGALP